MIHCVSSIQNHFLRILREKLDAEIFQMFFEDQFGLYCGENADMLFVTAESSFVLDWYRRKFLPLFQEIAPQIIPSFSGTVCIASREELKAFRQSEFVSDDSRLKKTQCKKPVPASSADFQTNRERIAYRKKNSREILASARRMMIPGVLDVLAGPSAEKILDTVNNRPIAELPSADSGNEKGGESVAISAKQPRKPASRTLNAARHSTVNHSIVGPMRDFLAQMEEMFRQEKISRITAPECVEKTVEQNFLEDVEPDFLAEEKWTTPLEQASPSIGTERPIDDLESSGALVLENTSSPEEFHGSSKLQKLMASVLKNSEDTVAISSTGVTSSQNGFSETSHEVTLRNEPRKLSRNAGFSTRTFETFVVGYSNRVAYSTARGIHLNMGLMSPVLFTGGTGVGKTHLLDAIYRNSVKCGFATVYKTCEEFINDFVASLRDQRKKNDFLETYRQCDLLLLDNLQFLLGKQGTINELQNIFNYRIRHGKQIVLASDRSLEKMEELGPEFLSKLRGGCVCHLNEPSFDVRLGILAQESKARKLPLSDEQCQKLANQYVGDVRAILGALNTLEMMTRSQFGIPGRKNSMPSREQNQVVQQLVDNMVNQPGKSVSMDDIKRFVAVQFGIDTVLLSSGARIRKISQPRMLAMWLARKFTRKSLAEIGHSFGCTSHSTVISAQKKVEEWRTHDFRVQTVDSVRSVNELLHQLETQLQRSL
ncbi:MAG: ATP-binding protein [Thermoguttaceae bacterium]|nr:ATP-binding protein [Thermoguttaceae bacterium]